MQFRQWKAKGTRRTAGAAALAVLLSSALLAGPLHRGAGQTRGGRVIGVSGQGEGQGGLRGSEARQYETELDKTLKTVRDRYYDKRIGGLDWTRVGDAYRARLASVQNRAEFVRLVNAMLAELHASHTEFVDASDVAFYMLPAVMEGDLRGHLVAHIGVMGRQDGNEYLVAAALDGGPAEKAGILSGDRLVRADGQPFQSAGSFVGKEGTPVRVELRRAGETTLQTVRVTPVKQNMLAAYLEATRSSARMLEVGGRKVGYVHLWTMADEAFKTTLDRLVLNKLYATDGLILDLRDGYGGHPWGFSDVFLRPDVTWEHQMREIRSVQHSGYTKPLVVLINGGTRSAKEFLAYQLRAAGRATLVGGRTAGAFLGAGVFPIGKESLLELAVDGLKLNGKPLEGVGVAPDVAVAPAFAYTSRDRQMAQAEQTLLKAMGGSVAAGAQRETILH